MSAAAITVENLGKKYRIGVAQNRAKNLGEAFRKAVASPFRYLKTRLSDVTSEETLWALRNINFEVKQGEVVGIIGKNGAGKSTLLKILSRITDPTEGSALIRGHVNSLLEVGTGFHAELTGRENIYMNAAMHGMKRRDIRRQFDGIVAFAEVEKFIDTPVKYYSSGMYVRLAFAVAAHLEPEILIVDEVLAVGDMDFQKKCIEKMGDVGRQGRTVLLVSHNMPSVMNLCTRALLLQGGQIVKSGSAGDVVEHYLATTRTTEGQVIWTDPAHAPGNEIVRLHSVRILQEGIEGPTSGVDISKDVDIEITYWNLKPDAILYAALWLKDKTATPVLGSVNHKSVSLRDDPWSGRPHPLGLYRSVCRIPGNFLNDGRYSVTAIVGKNLMDTQILEEDVVSFYVEDTGPMRKEMYCSWIGTVRPKLAWNTLALDASSVSK